MHSDLDSGRENHMFWSEKGKGFQKRAAPLPLPHTPQISGEYHPGGIHSSLGGTQGVVTWNCQSTVHIREILLARDL